MRWNVYSASRIQRPCCAPHARLLVRKAIRATPATSPTASGQDYVHTCLIDSGPLIALFSPDDRHHARFDALVSELSANVLRLVTPWPCILEASYLLELSRRFESSSCSNGFTWAELSSIRSRPTIWLRSCRGCAATVSAASGKWTSQTHHSAGAQSKAV